MTLEVCREWSGMLGVAVLAIYSASRYVASSALRQANSRLWSSAAVEYAAGSVVPTQLLDWRFTSISGMFRGRHLLHRPMCLFTHRALLPFRLYLDL